MVTIKEMIGKPVMDQKGKIIGTCRSVILDHYGKKVVGFSIEDKIKIKKNFLLPIKKVKYISDQYIGVLPGYQNVEPVSEQRLKEALKENYQILDKEVFSVEGKLFGRVGDVCFHEMSGNLTEVIVSDGFLNDMLKGRKRIFLDGLYTMKEEGIALKGIVDEIDETQGGILNLMKEGSEKP